MGSKKIDFIQKNIPVDFYIQSIFLKYGKTKV
jgi:hypothetical protein